MPRLYLLLLPLLILVGCGRDMGRTCARSEACSGEGTCLKGVCSGYSCTEDDDCAEDMVCDLVGDVLACVAPCADDSACLGEQTCHPDLGVCL